VYKWQLIPFIMAMFYVALLNKVKLIATRQNSRTGKDNKARVLMDEKRRTLPQPLTRKGFLNSDVVTLAKEKWAYSKNHASILAKVLKNWQSPNPVNKVNFDVNNLRYREEINSLTQVINADGQVPIYRPTGLGFGVMIVLAVPGSMTLAAHCARAYDLLRRVYLAKPENPTILLLEFRQKLGLDEILSAQILYLLHDISACSLSTSSEAPHIYVNSSTRDKADIWAVFETMFSWNTGAQLSQYSIDPFASPNIAFNQQDISQSVIGMCPEALESWKKALERLMPDPAGAITSARSMVESAIKWIHHQKNAEQPSKDASTGRRLKDCLKLLAGADNDFDKPGIKIMVSGMETAVNGLDAARNAMSDGHGKSPDAPQVNPRIARLVVGLATTVTTFLLATYESRQRP
jgi:hypothetical protein